MRQRGFALITVLLVMALVSMLVSALIYQQGRDIRQTAIMLHQAQAVSVAAGLEAWVKKGLSLDARHSKIDHLGEQWAQPLPPVPFAGGEVAGRLLDAQARVNVNNLTLTGERLRYWRGVIGRLLADKQVAVPVDVLQDWVDADETPLPEGAESDTYLLQTPAYRAPNRPLVDLTGLQGAKGVSERGLARLRKVLVALPQPTPVNVNTADEVVLRALMPQMDPAVIRAWIQARDTAPARDVEEVWRFMAKASQRPLAEVRRALPAWAVSVSSRYFQLDGRLHYGEAQVRLGALFQRAGAQTRLVMRWFAPVWGWDAAGTL